jgi:hypothetical protein
MRPMEDGAHAVQCHAHPTAASFADLSPDGSQDGFDFTPAKISRGRLSEDPRQDAIPAAAHFAMISDLDIIASKIKAFARRSIRA